jgi:hypothetical protein
MDDIVLAGPLRRELAVAVHQEWPEADPGSPHIFYGQAGTGKACIGRAEKIDDVVSGNAQVSGGLEGVGIGCADIGQVSPWKHEHDPSVDRAGECHRVAVVDARAVYHHVHALGGLKQRCRSTVFQPP